MLQDFKTNFTGKVEVFNTKLKERLLKQFGKLNRVLGLFLGVLTKQKKQKSPKLKPNHDLGDRIKS